MGELAVRERRIAFHESLKALCSNVYFQPPANIQMKYPCFVYKIYDLSAVYADNIKYQDYAIYEITYIDANPDALVPAQLLTWPYSEYQTSFIADNLNHTVIRVTTNY